MSDTTHLLIPYAGPGSEAGRAVQAGLDLPRLNALLARMQPDPAFSFVGEATSFSAPHERVLARALGLPADDGRIPWAAWYRQQQGQQPADGAWAFVTPCQWQVSTDHVTLREPESLALDAADSQALLDIVGPWFAEDGITLHYDQPTRWLAQSPLFATLATASMDRVLRRDVRPWMPDAAQSRTLHRLHSEMQMLLYTHPFNDARAERGLPPVNAFWVHGAGALPGTPPGTAAPPQIPMDLRDAALREDWPAWGAAWQALDAGPVAALLQQAQSGVPVRLTLCGEQGTASFHGSSPGLAQKIQRFFRPYRWMDNTSQL